MTTSPNSFHALATLHVNGRDLQYFSLAAPGLAEYEIARLPYSIKVLLENLLRNEDGIKVNASTSPLWRRGPTPPTVTVRPRAKTLAKSPSPPHAC